MQHPWSLVARVGAAGLLILPLAGLSQVPPPAGRPPMEGSPMSMDPPMHGPWHGGFGPDGPRMPPPGPPFPGADSVGALRPPMLGALKLDEAQADKVFEILHAQAPAVRSATKTLRKANDELRALALSESYDAAKARTLADAASRAMGELALMRADADHRIWSVLTAEQRRRAEALPRPPKTLDE